MSKFIDIEIKKPIFGTYCGVRAKWIFKAKREGKLLRIKIPQGTCTISPSKFMKGATRIEKTFLIPDRPMVLYANTLTVDRPLEEHIQDSSMPFSVMERLREMGVEKHFR